jgi:hypothetical protein
MAHNLLKNSQPPTQPTPNLHHHATKKKSTIFREKAIDVQHKIVIFIPILCFLPRSLCDVIMLLNRPGASWLCPFIIFGFVWDFSSVSPFLIRL